MLVGQTKKDGAERDRVDQTMCKNGYPKTAIAEKVGGT